MKARWMLKWVPLLVAIALLACVPLWQRWQAASGTRSTGFGSKSDAYEVLNVSDGDTLLARSINTGKEARIRFACIDTPEVSHGNTPGQPFGDESKANLKKWIDAAGGEVIVQEVDRNSPTGTFHDRYGRIVGEVFIKHPQPSQPEEELLLNAEQVRSGMAYVYRKYARSCSQVEILEGLEKEAKQQRRGVWRDSNAVKPWDWRKTRL